MVLWVFLNPMQHKMFTGKNMGIAKARQIFAERIAEACRL
jgi:hypothetical protein